MPACTLYLLSLNVPIPQFLQTLSSTRTKPLLVSRVIRWVILPTSLSLVPTHHSLHLPHPALHNQLLTTIISTAPLLAQNIHWSLLLILPSSSAILPSSLQAQIAHQWTLQIGVPSRLLQDFTAKNARLLHPSTAGIPPLTGSLDSARMASSAQDLELSPELLQWAKTFSKEGGGAVSMLNLLAFKPGMKGEYLKYGKAFAESAGSRRGGNAKIVGSVIGAGEGWDEVAVAHYPSVWHFADMLASEDYQEVNKRHRVDSLKDTAILCTSEIGMEMDGLWKSAKL